MPTYAPVSDYPQYGRFERGKIAGLIRRREQLMQVPGYGHRVKIEIDAFSSALSYLQKNETQIPEEHLQVLKRRREFLTDKSPKNDYDRHEYGALTWLLKYVEESSGNTNVQASSN